ncbi:MAG: protein jag [Treponema sp.]|jgi:spoIIIJ-associated protein|nr:protein jag [Treponema sp.]
MIKEFEGRTEKEAIDKAAKELGVERDCFDVEILETHRGGLFKKAYVKIRVHTNDSNEVTSSKRAKRPSVPRREEISHAKIRDHASDGEAAPPDLEFEKTIIEYLDKVVGLMGIDGKASVVFREKRKLCINIASSESSFIIGKKGKTLDALQSIVSIYTVHLKHEDTRIILDCESYRMRREENLVRLAYNVADRVRESRASVLLEPMNPFDRRLIHTTLNDVENVETKSEGQGLYKQVRIFYKAAKH